MLCVFCKVATHFFFFFFFFFFFLLLLLLLLTVFQPNRKHTAFQLQRKLMNANSAQSVYYRHTCTVLTSDAFSKYRSWYGYWPQLLVVPEASFVLVNLHRTGRVPACPPRTVSSVSLRQPWRWASSEEVQCDSRGQRVTLCAVRAVTSVCSVVDRQMGGPAAAACESVWPQVFDQTARMKLSLWTCRSKNSWVLYSYREGSKKRFISIFYSEVQGLREWQILCVYLLSFVLKIHLLWVTTPRCGVCISWRFESS